MPIRSGDLGGVTLPANQEVLLYECLAPAVAGTVSINFCNKGDAPAYLRFGRTRGEDMSSPGALYFEFDVEIPPKGVLERTGIAVSVGTRLRGYCNVPTVDAPVYGFEKG